MDKAQAIQKFWEQFDVPAYDESTVPTASDKPTYPYITYSVKTDSIGNPIVLTASVWDYSTSWKRVEQIAQAVAKALGMYGFYKAKIDDGYMWLTKGVPFAQRMSDDNDSIRRIYINLMCEFLTAY
jgi:hypothetical protein